MQSFARRRRSLCLLRRQRLGAAVNGYPPLSAIRPRGVSLSSPPGGVAFGPRGGTPAEPPRGLLRKGVGGV